MGTRVLLQFNEFLVVSIMVFPSRTDDFMEVLNMVCSTIVDLPLYYVATYLISCEFVITSLVGTMLLLT